MSTEITHNQTQNKEYRLPCGQCLGETRHKVLESVDVKGDEPGWDYQYRDNYQIVQCQGCDSISFVDHPGWRPGKRLPRRVKEPSFPGVYAWAVRCTAQDSQTASASGRIALARLKEPRALPAQSALRPTK
jgi:hypothetical protein